jgi:flagellar hook-associated protein 1 FlgK
MSLLNIAVSGLTTSQASIQVASNNIANADDEDYSRQRAEVVTNTELYSGNGYLGTGSSVESINRVVNEFYNAQLIRDTSTFNELDSFVTNIEQLDSLFADEVSGLSSVIDDFFTSIETGAQDPTSITARQLVLSNSESLIERFHTLYERVESQNTAVNDEISALTGQVTALATSIAALNGSIEAKQASGATPNALLDERDALIRELAVMIDVDTTTDSNGMINVFVGNGQSLVVGSNSAALGVVASSENLGSYDITYIGATGTVQNITNSVSGGEIGGLLEFKEDVISLAFNSLGRIAIGLSEAINDQNQKGVDLDGDLGGLIFNDFNSTAIAQNRILIDDNNTGTVVDGGMQAIITDTTELTTSDYELTFSGAGGLDYEVKRLSDGVVFNGTLTAFTDTISFDGVAVDISAGVPAAGDTFYINPTKNAAIDIELSITRAQDLAYASAINVEADSLGNTGTGIVSNVSVVDVYDDTGSLLAEFSSVASTAELNPPILIRFNSTTDYDVINSNTGVAISSGVSFVSGQTNTISVGSPTAYEFELSGAPESCDEFTVSYNGTGVSDNSNAVALGDVRLAGILGSGDLNLENAYGQFVGIIGAETAQSMISRDAAETLMLSSEASRNSVSGVNLDEEAADLIKYEQLYSASAQVLTVARQLFDTLLAAF